MGFSQAQAKKALRETVSAATMKDAGAKHKLVTYYDFFQNGDAERAVDWLFSHPDEPVDNEGDTAPAEKTVVGGKKYKQHGCERNQGRLVLTSRF